MAFVWNPDRRVRKGFFDLTSELCRLAASTREEVLVSLPYLHFLIVAAGAVRGGSGAQVQFAVGRVIPSESNTEIDLLFCSEFHKID